MIIIAALEKFSKIFITLRLYWMSFQDFGGKFLSVLDIYNVTCLMIFENIEEEFMRPYLSENTYMF